MSASFDLTPLLARRNEFKNFLAARLGGNHADAEDLLQNGLAKALRSAADLNDREKLVPWFYQLLRHAVVDHVRSHNAARNRENNWTEDTAQLAAEETAAQLCRCFESLLPTLKPQQAELLRRVEMGNHTVAHAAADLGLTAGNASVILHRARRELRERLVAFCGPCADASCFDCDCTDTPRP